MEALLAELRAAKARVLILIEGYQDFARLNLIAAAQAEVSAHLEDAKTRASLLSNVINAIENLIADGYPELPRREVSETVFDDLTENLTGMQTAIREFEELMLTITGTLEVGPEVPIPEP